ncbi:MAG: transposase [Cyanobacteria bacterium HKST-UBA02]|nr:transposase [Cyanobacteria bacterium HKST-UBA02]
MAKRPKSSGYTKEFQENAVRLAISPGRSVASVALELKVPAWKLRNWVQAHKQKLERSSEVDELIRLQNELKEAREEIEILKKAAAYFARSHK